jgi:cyclic-di-GMP-binding protein
MPSFDIVSEVDKQELDNAINQARKELVNRFDFKGSNATIELELKESKIKLTAQDASRLKSLEEIIIGKIAKRNIDLRNIERKDPAISPLGHATQEFIIQQGLEGEKAKEIIKAIKAGGYKVQSTLQERQVRVTGKNRDDLQAVIGFCRSQDFAVSLEFKNFRD